ncbi:hypothetical protein SS50377_21860 [Spironucleus salmonicida]|uniref:Uncharacterized protein n=1 Tax=Spironucleus salmonicida TaxID=348837 RepID=V6LUC0_9EUKA|nr:hypothetical protein SS50377_21860 [Spironucleus salmonicida]|eukprot:EST44404.1 Hypothetical protein SS50377_15709 [Spironucleus salmonicida]
MKNLSADFDYLLTQTFRHLKHQIKKTQLFFYDPSAPFAVPDVPKSPIFQLQPLLDNAEISIIEFQKTILEINNKLNLLKIDQKYINHKTNSVEQHSQIHKKQLSEIDHLAMQNQQLLDLKNENYRTKQLFPLPKIQKTEVQHKDVQRLQMLLNGLQEQFTNQRMEINALNDGIFEKQTELQYLKLELEELEEEERKVVVRPEIEKCIQCVEVVPQEAQTKQIRHPSPTKFTPLSKSKKYLTFDQIKKEDIQLVQKKIIQLGM